MQWRLLLFLLIMVLVVVFSIANAEPVKFNYLLGRGTLSLALIIIISTLVGAIAAFVSNLGSYLRLRNALYEKDKQLRALGQDNSELHDELGERRARRRKKKRRNEG